MLTITSRVRQVCGGVSRRELLQAAGAGLLGLNLPGVIAAQTKGKVRARSVMFLFLFGGPSQLETFDMKPDAASGIRGPFKPIASRTPGLRISEHLPKLAAMSDRFAVVRTMTHRQNDHNACHYIQTGHPMPIVPRGAAGVDATDKDWPALGSVVEYLDRRTRRSDLPSYVYLPNRLGHIQGYDRLGQYGGWLGRSYNALATEIRKRNKSDNPYFRPCSDEELDFRIPGLDPAPGMTLDRLNARRSLIEQFDTQNRKVESEATRSFNDAQQQAFALATSEKLRQALDIRRQPERLRDRYGRHLFGQAALMGRSMIEAGARFVTVLWDAPDGYSWDSHQHSDDVQKYLLPGLDQTLSALLTDLADRGLLDDTLVVCLGEMGRTPKGNARWGRDHWGYCFPAILAGAGIRGGALYGQSDKDAGYPIENPVSPEDLAATILHAIGIDPETRINDALGRPVSLVDGGKPLLGLFSASRRGA